MSSVKKPGKKPKTEREPSKKTKRQTGGGQNGAREQAKKSNNEYLKEVLDVAMTQVNGAAYTTGGLNFVAVDSAKLSGEDRRDCEDPLDLSQKSDLIQNKVDFDHAGINATENRANKSLAQQCNQQNQLQRQSKDLTMEMEDFVDSSQPSLPKSMSFRSRTLAASLSAATDRWNKTTTSKHDVDGVNHHQEPRRPGSLAIKFPIVKDADGSSRLNVPAPKAKAEAKSVVRHTTASTPKSKTSKDKPLLSLTAVDVPMETEDFVDNSQPAVPKSMSFRSRIHVASLSAAAGKTNDPFLVLSQPLHKTMIDDALDPKLDVDDVDPHLVPRRPGSLAIRCPTFSDVDKTSRSKVPVPKTTTIGEQRKEQRASSTPKSKTSNDKPNLSPIAGFHGEDEMDDEDSLSLQDFDDGSSEDWEPPFPLGNAIPTTSDAANRNTGQKTVNVSEKENDGDSLYRKKYHDLLEKYEQKCKAYKEMKNKNEKQKMKIAEMKDLVVFANAEAKKALADPNAKVTFTTDSEIDISFQQIEEVNAASNSDIQFGQNLALFFYGANTLREMSVKGVATHRFKNAKARPGISPKKLTFIHEKVQQRVAARVGANNLATINALANSTLINKGIGEKIANLNKAVRLSAARNALRDAEQNPNPAAKD
ncbi:uncharacterized protein LOC109418685 [Aedes albopictus]|uniref:BEN domain-containing protein n=1 Tax=Aedes albopictus TaxID=7160 RepID=A0ABM1XV09_AEDAL